jgi:uncharacterized protein (DUF1330 family)
VRSTVNIFLQEHFMKRKGLLFLVLATLVAGGAFAQKVGDSLNAFGKNYTVKDIRDGEVILMLTPTLDGTWKRDDGNVVTFNGNTAVYKQFSSALYQDAAKKGYLKVGGQAYRNLKKTDGLTWSGQVFAAYYNPDNPNVATKADWTNITIKMNPDGKTFQQYMGEAATGNQYTTWTRQ